MGWGGVWRDSLGQLIWQANSWDLSLETCTFSGLWAYQSLSAPQRRCEPIWSSKPETGTEWASNQASKTGSRGQSLSPRERNWPVAQNSQKAGTSQGHRWDNATLCSHNLASPTSGTNLNYQMMNVLNTPQAMELSKETRTPGAWKAGSVTICSWLFRIRNGWSKNKFTFVLWSFPLSFAFPPNFLVKLFLANCNFAFKKAKGNTVFWVHKGWVMACQQKVKRSEKKHVRSITGILFFHPLLTTVFLYESDQVCSLDNCAKACFFHEETVTERWEETVGSLDQTFSNTALLIAMILFTHPWWNRKK